jgi:hypothetical protein
VRYPKTYAVGPWMPASMDVAVGFQGSIDFDMVMRGRLPLRVERTATLR